MHRTSCARESVRFLFVCPRRILALFGGLTSCIFCLIPYQLHDLNDLNDFLGVGKSCKSFISFNSFTLQGNKQKTPQFCKRRGYWSAAPAKAGAFRIEAAGGWRPEKALCNSSNALLHAFSASRLERLLLLGPGAYPGRRGWVGSPEGVGRDRRKSRPPPLAPAGSVQRPTHFDAFCPLDKPAKHKKEAPKGRTVPGRAEVLL